MCVSLHTHSIGCLSLGNPEKYIYFKTSTEGCVCVSMWVRDCVPVHVCVCSYICVCSSVHVGGCEYTPVCGGQISSVILICCPPFYSEIESLTGLKFS